MKLLIWTGMLFGGGVGGYIPVMFGSSLFSMASLLGNGVGGLIGLFAGYKLAIALSLE